jgi:hypothetical protein
MRFEKAENAAGSVHFDAFDSNEMDESDLHYKKHGDPRISALLAITIH